LRIGGGAAATESGKCVASGATVHIEARSETHAGLTGHRAGDRIDLLKDTLGGRKSRDLIGSETGNGAADCGGSFPDPGIFRRLPETGLHWCILSVKERRETQSHDKPTVMGWFPN
jgi:hypothetical protein